MRSIVVRVLINAAAIWLAAFIVPGIALGGADGGEQAVTVLLVGAIFGIVNTVIGGVVRVVAFPFVILTLGLLALVINALLLWLTAWVSDAVGLAFTVDGFWAAFLGALVVSIASIGLGTLLRRG